jgi:two-component system sensor histidine kinase PilS (NtrC family)
VAGGGRPSAVVVQAFAARLVALAAVFAISVFTEVHGTSGYSSRQFDALYALVLAGFLLSLAWGALAAWSRRGVDLRVELLADFAVISALVYVTGGARSSLAFLYVIWIVNASMAAGPRAAAYSLACATAGYAAVALGPAFGWVPPFEPEAARPRSDAVNAFLVHALAFLGVAVLARQLAKQVQRGRRELDELGEIHRGIVDNVASGLLSVDRYGLILSFNREAERITGYPARQAVGVPVSRLFPELAEGGAMAALEELAASEPENDGRGLVSRMNLSFESRDGERRQLGMSASVLRGADGGVQGAILIFQDLTQLAEMEEQLRRSERLSAVGRLAAGLAHEIRNPLASLSGAIELLSADLPRGDAPSRRLVEIVGRETARLDRLVGDFLTYARPGPGELEPVALRPLLEDLRTLAEGGEHGERSVELDAAADLEVGGNADQLKQVFWNLIRNATEASEPGASVRIEAERVDEQVQIRVIDHGEGIRPEALDRIFEPFYTTRPKGTGLGLATVHRIVEAHGGALSVDSAPGEGTTIVVCLPEPTS